MDNLFHCSKCIPHSVFLTKMEYLNHHFEQHEKPLPKAVNRKCYNFNEKHLILSHLNNSINYQSEEPCQITCKLNRHFCTLPAGHDWPHHFSECDDGCIKGQIYYETRLIPSLNNSIEKKSYQLIEKKASYNNGYY